MTSFKYEMQTPGGQITAGTVQAESVMDATSQLRARGGYVLRVVPSVLGPQDILAKLRSVSFEFGPNLKDIHSFTNQLAVMIKAGINVRTAIAGIADQVDNLKFKRIIQQIKDDVESGHPFSEALAKYPKVFSPLYVNMVRASELSGSFGHMLDRIATYLAQQLETRSMIRGAMVYPVIIGVMAIATTIFLLTFVLPKFTALFAGKEDLLPKPTLILIGLSAAMRKFWYLFLGGVGGLVGGFLWWIRTPFGRLCWDRFKLRAPLLKRMFRALCITRGMHTMGELVNAGVPMLETLAITADVSGNSLYEAMWRDVHGAVQQGKKIAQPLARYTLLPANVVQMVTAGEESGKLGEVLRDIAEYYAKELRATIKSVTAMIEPLMIVVMGLIVGFIAMSIILPIFKMSSLVK
ncbi:MAG TPA: type II secretion system F family protein [Phycisphaerales bacterium]|nr:type II secretion system F family protein [Phycisphaerales bacterium]